MKYLAIIILIGFLTWLGYIAYLTFKPDKCTKCGADTYHWGNDRWFCSKCGEEQK